MFILFFIFFIFNLQAQQPSPLINLEDYAQDFVLESKRIIIPRYPHAFNPSLIRWHGKLLLSFRFIPNSAQPFTSYIALCWMNEDFTPKGNPQILTLRDPESPVPSRIDDARLITIDDKLHLIYSDNPEPVLSKGGFRVHIAKILYKNKRFSVQAIDRITEFEGDDSNKREKNWVPFIYNNELMTAYSINPHIILQPHIGLSKASTVAKTAHSLQWQWGELRGGTQAIKNGDHYLSFFHSSKKIASIHSEGKEMLHYVMGAYTFKAEPPFTLTHISPEPIIGKHFYTGEQYKPYWGSVRVVFPCGFVCDDQYIWITFGRQDHEMWVTKLDKQKLYASLVPIL